MLLLLFQEFMSVLQCWTSELCASLSSGDEGLTLENPKSDWVDVVPCEILHSFLGTAELSQRFPADVSRLSFAVLTPYKAQLVLLKSHFRRHCKNFSTVDFATVDGFQVRGK
jgi:AAA domain